MNSVIVHNEFLLAVSRLKRIHGVELPKDHLDQVFGDITDGLSLINWAVLKSPLVGSPIHGASHWASVFVNGVLILKECGILDIEHRSQEALKVITLFSLFHDCRRSSEGSCNLHGAFGAMALTTYVRYHHSSLTDQQIDLFDLASYACNLHTIMDYPVQCDMFDCPDFKDIDREFSRTLIGVCLDSDRLDLRRLRMSIHSAYLTHRESMVVYNKLIQLSIN